jgi:integrase
MNSVEAVAAYRPRGMPAAAGTFARSVVGSIDAPSAARARALLWACARLATFGLSVGMEPDPVVLLHPSVIERFVIVGATECSPAGRRTLRTNLRFVARRHLRVGPDPVLLSRERAKAPYTPAEIGAYLRLADAQGTPQRRMRAQGLICLGAGAGLLGADLRRVRGSDVVTRSGGLVVVVGGPRARVVPVLHGYASRLAASAAHAGTGWVVGGVDPDRHNVTTPLVSSLRGGADLGRLDTRRLRAAWLAELAGAIGLRAFMDAAGIRCSQRLGDLVAGLASPTEAEAVSLLGARR